MVTTIQITEQTKKDLDKLKKTPRETYEQVIEELIESAEEDNLEFSKETKESIKESRRDIKAGRVLTTSELVKELGLV